MTAVLEVSSTGRRPADLPSSPQPEGPTLERVPTRRNTAIQGLRAVAVLAVVGDHLVQRPSGGFVGVDIFFVISGFLITSLLLREIDRNGRISIVDFYRRRIKRTLPLAAAVILVTLVLGAFLFPDYRVAQLRAAASAAATFSINWQLIAQGTDYLHATDLPTPLQHFWSLAVEEQFYLIWPAAIVLALLAARRVLNKPPSRPVVGVLAGILTVASVSWCVWQTAAAPTAAYFSTASRGWELGVGALLASAGPALRRLPGYLAPPIAWAGFIGLGAAFFVITPDSPFPAPWAVLPVAATVAIIVASEAREDAQLYPLTNRASQYVGDLSYSVYLWHYPVVIFGAALLAPSKGTHALELLLIGGVSVLSFHLIETPLRVASWRRIVFRRGAVAKRQGQRPVWRLVGAGSIVVIAAALTPGFISPTVAQAVPSADLLTSASTPSTLAADRLEIDRASSATDWPATVTSAVHDQVQQLPSEWVADRCLWLHTDVEEPQAVADRCTFGSRNASHTAVLYGDSIAISYYPAIRRALASSQWRITIMTAEQCPANAMTVVLDDGTPYPGCGQYRAWALGHIKALHPDLVITASSYSALWRWRVAPGATDALTAWQVGARSTITSLASDSNRVLVLDAPEMGPQLRDCLTPIATPEQCAGAVSQQYVDALTAERTAVAPLVSTGRVLHPSTMSWYCTAAGICPAFIGDEPTLADGMHASLLDAPRIGRFIQRALTAS